MHTEHTGQSSPIEKGNEMESVTDYFESAENQIISKERAMKELRNHGVDDDLSIAQFIAELGDEPIYNAQDVLAWLGY